MIRRITLALVAVILMATAVHAQKKVATEFRGMNFGADLSEFKNMTPAEVLNPVRFYKKYADEKSFQGVPLKEQFRYGFVDNKFALAMLSAQGPSAYSTLKAYFDATYGEPSQPTKNVKQFKYGAGDVTIELGYDDRSKMCEVSYIYRPLMGKMAMPPKQ